MKTSHLLFLVLLGTSLIACSTWKKNMTPTVADTPGTIQLNDTLFCDESETTNFNWLEYMYWLSVAYGEDSPEYQNALPIEGIWSEQICLTAYKGEYWRKRSFASYPIVGITQEQAENYSKWRSDRVFEYYLIKNKYMDFNLPDSVPPGYQYFSIQGYFDGSFEPLYLKDDPSKPFIRDTTLLYPTYRLPSSLDREIMLDYADSTDYLFATAYPKKEQEWTNAQLAQVYLEINPCDSNMTIIEPIVDVEHGYPHMRNIKFLHNIRGNVAEWSSEEHLTFGGGWPHTRSYTYKHDTISCEQPNAWTGFRNVCTWSKFSH